MMRISNSSERRLLALVSSAVIVGCADDHAGSSSGHSASETADTGDSTSTDATDSDATGDTGAVDLTPWFGTWYTLYPQLSINALTRWDSGGASFGFTLFNLRSGGATIYDEWCLWGSEKFDYTTRVGEDGLVVLEPVGGVHKFLPHGEIRRLYIQTGADCASLVVKEVGQNGEEGDLFSSSGAPLARGKLCLEYCAEAEGEYGLISDCGTPVPWDCGE